MWPVAGALSLLLSVQPEPRYVELLEAYAAGRHAESVAALDGWSEAELATQLAALQELAATARRCRSPRPGDSGRSLAEACTARAHFERLPLRAALMLHADREELEHARLSPAQCGDRLHLRIAERLAGLLMLQPEGPEFARRFYLGLALQAHSRGCTLDGQRWCRVGLARFPDDASLHLALGAMTETVAFLTESPPSFRSVPTAAELRQATAVGQQRRESWSQARRELERALAAEPGLHEAGLRLGRVLMRLDKHEEATARLEAVVAQSPQQGLRYLARLFLGRIHERAGRRPQAQAEYRGALEIEPSSPVARVALAHLEETEGEAATARELLERVVAPGRDPELVDPYWAYYAAIPSLPTATILEALRREARR